MTNSPTIVCRVSLRIDSPVQADPGDVLVVWPGHPTHALMVMTDDRQLVRHAACPEGVLYGSLLHLFLDSAIQPLTVRSERALLRVA